MPKKRVCETSRLAHNSIKEHKAAVYEKIEKALEKLKIGGTFEEIAEAALLDPPQVWKRLSEMQRDGTIFNLPTTRPTKSGREAMVRQLVKLRVPDVGVQADLF
jgi:hypothetical protein